MEKTPQQEAEEMLKKFGKEDAIKRVTAIVSAHNLRSFVGTSGGREEHWQKVLDILINADGSKYPAPIRKTKDLS